MSAIGMNGWYKWWPYKRCLVTTMNEPLPVNSPMPDDSVQALDSELAKLEREIKSEADKYRATLLKAQKYRLEARLEALRSANAAR
jgi:hypothetical protein